MYTQYCAAAAADLFDENVKEQSRQGKRAVYESVVLKSSAADSPVDYLESTSIRSADGFFPLFR